MAYQKVLDQLTPDNMMVFLIAKGLKTDKKEYFYQAPYSYMEDEKFYKELIKLPQEKDLVMREPNPFIPKLASLPDREIDLNNTPDVLLDTEGEKIYYGQDKESV